MPESATAAAAQLGAATADRIEAAMRDAFVGGVTALFAIVFVGGRVRRIASRRPQPVRTAPVEREACTPAATKSGKAGDQTPANWNLMRRWTYSFGADSVER